MIGSLLLDDWDPLYGRAAVSDPAVIGGEVDVNRPVVGGGLGGPEPPVHWEVWCEWAPCYWELLRCLEIPLIREVGEDWDDPCYLGSVLCLSLCYWGETGMTRAPCYLQSLMCLVPCYVVGIGMTRALLISGVAEHPVTGEMGEASVPCVGGWHERPPCYLGGTPITPVPRGLWGGGLTSTPSRAEEGWAAWARGGACPALLPQHRRVAQTYPIPGCCWLKAFNELNFLALPCRTLFPAFN